MNFRHAIWGSAVTAAMSASAAYGTTLYTGTLPVYDNQYIEQVGAILASETSSSRSYVTSSANGALTLTDYTPLDFGLTPGTQSGSGSNFLFNYSFSLASSMSINATVFNRETQATFPLSLDIINSSGQVVGRGVYVTDNPQWDGFIGFSTQSLSAGNYVLQISGALSIPNSYGIFDAEVASGYNSVFSNVSPVPLPASLGLFGAVVVGLVSIGSRKARCRSTS